VLRQKPSPGHSPSLRFCARSRGMGGKSGGQERGRRYIKSSGAAGVEAKQRIQLQKNKHTASSHTLSYSLIQTLLPHFFSLPPPIQKRETMSSNSNFTYSQSSNGSQASDPAAAATPVASSAAAPADTTPPQHPSRRRETARRPRPTPRTQSTSLKTEQPPRAHSQARAVTTHLLSTATLYSEPSLRLSKPSADQAPQQPRARKA
jgi:hypothetical protein